VTVAPGARGGLIERAAPRALGRDFRWLWAQSTVTNLGDGMLLAAGPLLVTTLTREPFAVAASVFLQQLPWSCSASRPGPSSTARIGGA
jgi:hypothetical protein